MGRRLATLWRNRGSFVVKFAAIILATGVVIAVIPLMLAHGEGQRQAQARAADKAGLTANLLVQQRRSVQGFAVALAGQVGGLIAAGDSKGLASTLTQDSQASGGGDVIGVAQGEQTYLYRMGRPVSDAQYRSAVLDALRVNALVFSDASGRPWILEAAASTGNGIALVARLIDEAAVQSLAQTIASTGDAASLAVARAGRWVVGGSLAGRAVSAGDVEPPAITKLPHDTAAVVTALGGDVGVATADIGEGYTVVVSSAVSEVATLWAPVLLLSGVILVAMLLIVLVVHTDVRGPLARLDRAVSELGRGDFDAEIPAGGEDEIGRLGRSFETLRDELRATLRSGAARAAIATELNAPQPLETALSGVAAQMCDATDAAAAIIVVNGTEMNDSFIVAAGIDPGELSASDLLSGGGPVGTVFRQSASGGCELGSSADSYEAAHGLRSLCLAPLRMGQLTLGVIGIARADGGFRQTQRDLVESAAEQVVLALERYRFLAVVQRQASIDDLTGLYNHRFLVDYLGQQIALAERLGTPLAILMLDLDHFKLLNDTYGHHAGDEALRAFAATLTQSVRRADLAARYGGEEFVVVMSNAGAREAALVAEKIRDAVASTPAGLGASGQTKITVSIGGAAFPEHTTTARELLAMADRALYAAKRAGRNRVAMADESIIGRTTGRSPGVAPEKRRKRGDAVAGHRPSE